MSGWIRLHRRLQDHPFWRQRRRFSRAEAWLDLLLDAHWRDEGVLLGSRFVHVKRGQVLFSARKKARRWGWSRNTSLDWFRFLEAHQMVSREVSHGPDGGYTLLTILNYDKYQKPTDVMEEEELSHGMGHDLSHGRATVEPRTEQREEVKKGKKNTSADADASAEASKRNGTARKTDPETDTLLQEFADAFHAKLAEPYLIEWGRDRKLMGGLVATYGAASVREKLRAFFKHGTRETRERRAWTVQQFRYVFPQLVGMKAMGDL